MSYPTDDISTKTAACVNNAARIGLKSKALPNLMSPDDFGRTELTTSPMGLLPWGVSFRKKFRSERPYLGSSADRSGDFFSSQFSAKNFFRLCRSKLAFWNA